MEQQIIPKGYKQTEVGVIPEDWNSNYLGEVAEIRMCKRVLSWQTSNSGDIPFYKIGTFGGLPNAFISNILYKDFKSKFSFPEQNDVLISAAGTIGKTVVYDGKDAYFQDSNIVWLEIDKRKIINEYLYHYYKIIKWASTEGSTISRLYNGIIKASLIAIPPIDEQTAIANALSDVDALIASIEKLIAKKQAIKTATMQQLLTGKKRLPPFDKHPDGTPKGTQQTELGEIPEDWDWFAIPELVLKGANSIKIGPFGSALKKEYLIKAGYKVYGQENIYHKNMNIGDRYISQDHFTQLKSCNINTGDFLISMMGTVGKCFIVPSGIEEGIMDSHLLRLRINQSLLVPGLLIQLFQTPIILKQIKQLSVGGIMEGLSSKIIKSLILPLGNIEEQKAIQKVLFSMDDELFSLKNRLTKTKKIKQGMMQELLTGKTRLPISDNNPEVE